MAKRWSAGYDTDKFIFVVDKQEYRRFYGSRLTNQQAVNLFIKELKKEQENTGE